MHDGQLRVSVEIILLLNIVLHAADNLVKGGCRHEGSISVLAIDVHEVEPVCVLKQGGIVGAGESLKPDGKQLACTDLLVDLQQDAIREGNVLCAIHRDASDLERNFEDGEVMVRDAKNRCIPFQNDLAQASWKAFVHGPSELHFKILLLRRYSVIREADFLVWHN